MCHSRVSGNPGGFCEISTDCASKRLNDHCIWFTLARSENDFRCHSRESGTKAQSALNAQRAARKGERSE